MKLALINGMEGKEHGIERIIEVAPQVGHELTVFSMNNPALLTLHNESTVFLTETGPVSLQQFDAVILKIGIAQFDLGQIFGASFECLGVPCFSPPRSLYLVRNKFLHLSMLSQKGIPVPRSIFTPSKSQVAEFFSPEQKMVLKTNQGSRGVGVFLAENRAHLNALQDYFDTINEPYFVQEFVEGSFGEDVRVFVLGGEVLGSIRRAAKDPQEFRSNVFLGGRVEPITLTDSERDMAIKAADIFGLSFAGVDLIRGKEQSYIIEVNGNPGFKGIELAYDICVPSHLFSFIESRIR